MLLRTRLGGRISLPGAFRAGIPKDSPAGRKRFAQCMEHRRRHESPDADWKAVERGWFLGDKAFKEELLAQMRERRKDHYGPELREASALWRIDREFG